MLFDKDNLAKNKNQSTIMDIEKEQAAENAKRIQEKLKEAIISGRVGSLTVDPLYLYFEEVESELIDLDQVNKTFVFNFVSLSNF